MAPLFVNGALREDYWLGPDNRPDAVSTGSDKVIIKFNLRGSPQGQVPHIWSGDRTHRVHTAGVRDVSPLLLIEARRQNFSTCYSIPFIPRSSCTIIYRIIRGERILEFRAETYWEFKGNWLNIKISPINLHWWTTFHSIRVNLTSIKTCNVQLKPRVTTELRCSIILKVTFHV